MDELDDIRSMFSNGLLNSSKRSAYHTIAAGNADVLRLKRFLLPEHVVSIRCNSRCNRCLSLQVVVLELDTIDSGSPVEIHCTQCNGDVYIW